jgi:hypothetical protein
MSLWTVRALQRVIDDAYDKDVKKQVLTSDSGSEYRLGVSTPNPYSEPVLPTPAQATERRSATYCTSAKPATTSA